MAGDRSAFSWARSALAALALLAASSPASAAWRKAESANFIVYSQNGEQALRERVALLEDYDHFLRILTGISDPPSPNKLPVYVVRNHAALNSVRQMPATVGGFYSASTSGIAAFADDSAGGSGDESNQILLHEIAHHFMLQYRPLAYPPWYVEGFAEYVMTARFTKDRIEFGQPSRNRAIWLTTTKWVPLDKILFGTVPLDPETVSLYYGESWLLVHYLLRDTDRKAKLVAYLKATAGGEAPRAAFKRIFAEEPKQLQDELDHYGEHGMTYTRLSRASASAPPAMEVTTLPASADDLLLAEAAIRIGVEDAQRAPLLARVRAAASKLSDAYAKRVQAEAEALYGDGAVADQLLDSLLAAAPNDAELLYFKGMRQLVAERSNPPDRALRAKQAQSWFGRAHKADPNHFQTLVGYVESQNGTRNFVSENNSEVLLLAHMLAPQVGDITINAAFMLLLESHFDDAANLLAPLSSDPHNPQLAATATALLAMARDRKQPGSVPTAIVPAIAPPATPGKPENGSGRR